MSADFNLSPRTPAKDPLPDHSAPPTDVEAARDQYLLPVITCCGGSWEQRGAGAGRLDLYFPDRAAYDAWAQHVDDEAPGLRAWLLAVDAPDGGRLRSDQSDQGAET